MLNKLTVFTCVLFTACSAQSVERVPATSYKLQGTPLIMIDVQSGDQRTQLFYDKGRFAQIRRGVASVKLWQGMAAFNVPAYKKKSSIRMDADAIRNDPSSTLHCSLGTKAVSDTLMFRAAGISYYLVKRYRDCVGRYASRNGRVVYKDLMRADMEGIETFVDLSAPKTR